MQPDPEPDEMSAVLEAGYAAPPLEAAFSANLVRQMQAEVVPQTSRPQNRRLRGTVVLCVAGVAASIMAAFYFSIRLPKHSWPSLREGSSHTTSGTKPTQDEVAMQSLPSSSFELSSSPESESIRSFQTELIPANDARVSDINPLSEDALRTFSLESLAKNISEVPSDFQEEQATRANDGYRNPKSLESMSAAVMEEFEVVTQERAKALGLSLTSQDNGPDAVRISLEFEKKEELKEYRRTELRQFEGGKLLLSVALKEHESNPGRVVVGLVADRSNLATLSLDIVAQDARGSRVRYALPMKDFVTKPERVTQP